MDIRYRTSKQRLKTDDPQVTYYDLLTSNLELFELSKDAITYELKRTDIQRPDILMHTLYGDSSFADVLLYVNGKFSLFDFEVGERIIVPTPENIRSFLSRYRE